MPGFFSEKGGIINGQEDIELQIMRIGLVLAQGTATPVTYWLDMGLSELHEWIDAARSLGEKNG